MNLPDQVGAVLSRIRSLTIVVRIGCMGLAACSGTPSPVPSPSVVLIVVDTLRADHLGLYGHDRATSPALDEWAKRGAVFERSFATSPWTLPTFASIYTGQIPTRHGAGAIVDVNDDAESEGVPLGGVVIDGKPKWFAGLRADVATLGEILGGQGYVTGAVVNNPFLDPIFGVARGFGHYDHASGNDHQMRRADRMVDRALAWADAHRTQPFFLVVHFFDPHMNYDPPPAVRGRFTSTVLPSRFALPVHNTDAIRKYAGQLTTNDRAFIAAAYDEEIAFVDREIGRLLATLKDQHLERLLIVLTADHGEELFDHGGFGHGHAMYDELLRVPLMVWGPGVRPARIATPVSVIDIAPTVLNAAGIEPPAPMAGISLWPILTSTPIAGEPTPAEDRVLVAERTGQHPERKVVIQWPYKAVSDPDGGPPQLFDLSADPGETVDRANAEKAVGTRLARHLEAAFAAPPDDAGGQAAAMDEGVREQLRGLGYVE